MAGVMRRDPGGEPEPDAILDNMFCACEGDEDVLLLMLCCLEAEYPLELTEGGDAEVGDRGFLLAFLDELGDSWVL